MAFRSLCMILCIVFGTAAFGPVPRISWQNGDVDLTHFHVDGIFNYSTLLLSDEKDVLYIGAREAIFAVNSQNIAEKQHEVYWKVTQLKNDECSKKGKSKQTECLNYIRVLQPYNNNALYVCGTYAFQPTCDLLDLSSFKLLNKAEDGKGRCPFDPAHSYTSVMVDGELYSGTSYTFLGSEPIIYRHNPQSQIRTEYAVPWLNEPRFVYADVIRAPQSHPEGEDDKVYFFFTETSVEYDFFSKLQIPRIARVCKGDQGGLRTLQKKWTSFLKAKLLCNFPEKNLFFNIINDVFIIKSPNLREPLIYGVFSSNMNNVGLSAVCTYNISTIEDVFSKGKYMQSATVEQSNTKWVRFNGDVPKPRPGACINSEARSMNYTSSLNLPDKTLQFVKDHPLMDDPVTPVGGKPKLVNRNMIYTQIVVDQVKAVDGNIYDIMFMSTDKGMLHKAFSHENEMHIIEEIELLPDQQPVQTLLLSNKQSKRYIYAGSNNRVVQSPVSFCDKFTSCVDCVLTRDPYCAWHPEKNSCVDILQEGNTDRKLIQELNGNVSKCIDATEKRLRTLHRVTLNSINHTVEPGSMVVLNCSIKSNLASVSWDFKDKDLKIELPKYQFQETSLVIFSVAESDAGVYLCLSHEFVKSQLVSQVIVKHILELEKNPTPLLSTAQATTETEASSPILFPSATSSLSSVGTDFHPSLSSMHPEVLSSAKTELVRLLPPFLTDQGHISAQGSFQLFCHAIGPVDMHFTWEKDGTKMEGCAKEEQQNIADGTVHILSWITDITIRNAEYRCMVTSKSETRSSKVIITVSDALNQVWSNEFAKWRTAVNEHRNVMDGWKKTWESCNKKDVT
ncbi:semaphorin-4D isoform X2 [Bombina bombina]|uniref:semaphorin-4D isoform X2 n=1 Tax=Bombina bombina TaxID=8345 RepID=UPI00235A83D9|nr:semaphorin-4D isoform X2 [Bombina bombina]